MFIKQHRCIVQSILLTMLVLVAGCGGGSSSSSSGGDSGGGGDDPPLSSGKAITAFSFTAEANPPLGADLTGTVNEANGTILLAGPLDVDAVVGLKASFTTTGTQTQVSVGGIAQESGVTANSFAGPLTYRVTAEDGSTRDYQVHVAYWKHTSGLTDNISPDGQTAYSPQVAMDDSGNIVIVWYQHDGSNWQIFKSEYRDGEWTHPASLSDSISPDGQHAYDPQVAMDSSGNTVIVWHQYDGGITRIFKSEYRDGEWTHPTGPDDNISPDGWHALLPQVAMNDSGSAVIVWRQYDGSNDQIFKSEYRGGEWTHPANLSDNISPDGGDAELPRVAMDDLGNAVIVWEQSDGSLDRIFKSEYRDGTWTDPEGLDDYISLDAGGAELPQVAMDSSGNAVIAWLQSDGSRTQIFKSEYRGGEWTHPANPSDNISPDGQYTFDPLVAMDDLGNAVIAWRQSDGSRDQIFNSEYRGGEWTHPANLSDNISPDGWSAEFPQMAMDDSGNTVIVWDQPDGSKWQIFKSEYRGGEWTNPADPSDNISPDGQHALLPQVAMNDSGNAVVVWQQSDGSRNQIFKSEYRFWEE